jgi:predicted ArsR family transcriptional regulator
MATRVTGVLLSLLTDIADYRIILLSQIGYLHFSGKRSARRRMQQLERDGLVVVLPGPTARGGGRPEKVYGVSRTGLDLINSERPNSPQLGFDQVCGEKLGHQTGHQLLLNWCRVHLIHLTRQLPRVEHTVFFPRILRSHWMRKAACALSRTTCQGQKMTLRFGSRRTRPSF